MRHGLFLYSISNRLARVGIDIRPYYLELEGLDFCEEPKVKGNVDYYSTTFIERQEIFNLYRHLGHNAQDLEDSLTGIQRYIALKHKDEIAAIMVIQLEKYSFKKRVQALKENEAYLENMHTYESFRGRNLAPYLRYQAYQLLAKEGRTICYSISEYFNTSSLKFKKKLNAKHLKLCLYIEFFKKFKRNYLLKSYKINR